jgi:hypothetical protein
MTDRIPIDPRQIGRIADPVFSRCGLKRRIFRRSWTPRRSGVFVAELLLTMPVFMVFLLAVVQFGIFFGNSQVLILASRVGAAAASEITLTPGVPPAVENAVLKHLTSGGLPGYCRIRLEHNAFPGNPQAFLLPVAGSCDCEPDAILAPGERPPYVYVRLTVCVPLTDMMPNLLTVFGLDISSYPQAASSTTILRSEVY